MTATQGSADQSITGRRHPSSPPRGSGGAKRAIIQAAERLFAEQGYDASSTALIAKEAGVPSSLVFYHFPTKMDLLLAVVDQQPDPAQAHLAAVRSKTLRGRLRYVVRTMAGQPNRSRYPTVIVLRESQAHHEIARRAAELFAETCGAVAEVLSAAENIVDDPRRVLAAAELLVSRVFIDVVALGEVASSAPERYRAILDLLEQALADPSR